MNFSEISLLSRFPYRTLNQSLLVDVGAHVGSSSLPFAKRGWKVIAFEPETQNYLELQKNLSGYKNVTIIKRAVSNKNQSDVTFYVSPEHWGIHSLQPFHKSHKPSLTVDTVRLDTALSELNIPEVSLLKIDIEGADFLALQGFDFNRIKPEVVMCEFADSRSISNFGYSHHDIASYMQERGYQTFVSEWDKVQEYGRKQEVTKPHRFIQCRRYPLDHQPDWGNLIFVRSDRVSDFTKVLSDYLKELNTREQLQNPLTQLQLAFKNGESEKIYKLLFAIVSQYPLYLQARFLLIDKLLSDANFKQARASLEQTNNLFPNSPEVQKRLSDLQNRESVLQSSRQRLQAFKDIHKGQRCVIIGNGPSLNKMDLSFLKHEICFGMNRIYLGFEKWGFTPTYYVSINKLVLEQSAEEISKIPCLKFLSSKGIPCFSQQDDLLFVDTVNFQKPFSPNPLNGLNEGYTVTYFALQLAYYMGFETVVLIGVDHSFSTKGEANKEITSQGDDPNHFHPSYFGKGTRWQLPDLENSEKHYRLAEAHFRSDGRQIIDATVGGKCPVFPKADYRQLFAESLLHPSLQFSNQNKKKSKLSLFTTAKPFSGKASILQKNAIRSWMFFNSQVEVIVFGDAEGVKEISLELGLHHVPDVRCNEFGTPLLSDMFEKAQALASNDIIVYINADIILLSDFIPAIQKVAERFPEFLAVGQRWNLDQETLLDFNNENWEQELRQQVKAKGKLELGCAIDYFAFTKNLWPDFPDFAVGRPTWDNYTIYRTIADGFPVVDLTDQVMVVHQNHDYSHIPTGEVAHRKGVETDRNRALAIECIGLSRINTIYAYVGYTNHATWKLTEIGLIRTSDADKIEKLCRYLKQNDPELVRQVVQLLKDYQANPQNSDLEKMLQNIEAELTRFLLHLPSENCQKYKLASLGRAYQSLTRCLSQFSNRPNHEVSPVDQVSIYLKLAKIYLTQGSLEDASNACSEAIKLQPNHAESYYLISQVLQQQNKLTAATLARQKAEQLS
ncbi:FkbM family methyltransferase [Geitlerinema sp. P-1104]|uniref:FkbM family methyltransferase n=1 Tax=Geitlerinema sp. P-1104 TaxID=2546230 RepID=UPI001476F6A0|nr:FkbM family methyltransferase [Geitlerinema sp. P-1104]NMG59557.1 FkbM family methyltransferase [Geitlerinema sp. P-1104]